MPRQWSSTCSQSRTLRPSPYSDPAAVQEVGDEQRHELLGELARAVVVGAPGHPYVEAVGAVAGEGQQVARRLRRGVRGTRPQWILLGRRAGLQGAVDLVGGDVHEGPHAVAQGGVQQILGADDVRQDEVGRGVDRAVHVGLGGEVHHLVRLGRQPVDKRRVADVTVHELQPGVADLEVGGGPGVGQGVQDGDPRCPRPVGGEEGPDVPGADESGGAGDQDVHARFSALLRWGRSGAKGGVRRGRSACDATGRCFAARHRPGTRTAPAPRPARWAVSPPSGLAQSSPRTMFDSWPGCGARVALPSSTAGTQVRITLLLRSRRAFDHPVSSRRTAGLPLVSVVTRHHLPSGPARPSGSAPDALALPGPRTGRRETRARACPAAPTGSAGPR